MTTQQPKPNAQLGLRRTMVINTLSNYGKMIIGIAITIFLTRILFLGLSREEYGFWALLWSIFGYSLLLDFGFGVSIQKYTSETVVTQDWEKYNRIVSTVFFNYLMLSGLIALAGFVISFNLHRLFSFSPANEAYYRSVSLIFGIGSAIVFPFGFFSEIMRGLQKMHLRNIFQILFSVMNFLGLAGVVYLKMDLRVMAMVAIGINLFANLTMATVAHRLLPKMKIRTSYYDKTLLRSVMGFSFYAYLITFTNLVIFRTDQLVISIFGSVALVAVFQISSRLAETFRQFSAQFLDNLGPVAASLHAAGNKGKMAEIMLQSNRLMGIIATLLLIPLLVYVKPLLQIWLNLNDTAGAICAIILLLSMYNLLFFRSSSVYILLMANEQKLLSRIAIIECIANLGLSILLILNMQQITEYFGWKIPNANIIGVALGTLIPNVLLAFIFNIPKACRFANITIYEYFRVAVFRTVLIGIATASVSYLMYRLYYPTSLWMILFYCALTGFFYVMMTYVFGLEKWEQGQLKTALFKRFKRG
jgi:O-antigen/teichoic acid export membrane protein